MSVPNALIVRLALLTVFLHLACSQTCTQEEDRLLRRRCVGPSGEVCSNHGECACGVCTCQERYRGKYCQCDDYCATHNNKMCGGNGACNCGVCDCYSGWTGLACECSVSNATCIASNGKLCNGSGNCVCGSCKCSSWTDFFGPTCEDCLTCTGQCNTYRECALCKGFASGQYDREQCEQMCPNVQVVNSLTVDDKTAKEMKVKFCEFPDEDGCILEFSYRYDGGNPVIDVLSTKVCPNQNPSSSAVRYPWFGPNLILAAVIVAVLATLRP